ncbi:hypothetical protein O6H91_03G033700 [Diphasiastrum complanatum]|uniref:Uncharacterized protein n=1 Tax=Diphasiastrum complanatum TaxID=34168 RepID=A0ACC2E4V4_DIPCM|nr:hypothetical protein O6H91_03G033700 [Diphasiastrum complanatum]
MEIDHSHSHVKKPREDRRYITGRVVDDGEERQPLYFSDKESDIAYQNESQRKFSLKFAVHLLTCCFIIAHLIASVYYLLFKSMLYIRHFHQVLSAPWLLLVLACEGAYLFGSIVSALDNCLPPRRRPHLGDFDTRDRSNCPTVDILLPCCNEPTEVPLDSILAALAIDYPSDCFKVLVLDDGGDDTLLAECAALQADHSKGQLLYLRRKKLKGVPHNFKCGNLNYGLQHSHAEFVVMMDADMILHRSFLRRLLPHIVDSPQVAFVQIPQSFYNLPPGDPLDDACLLGYDRVLPHRDSLGSAGCVGTGAIFRRKHLDVINGFQPQSITEDTMTGYALFNQGFKSVFLSEKLQIGLAPWTFDGYIKQRLRWGQGAMQQLVCSWRIMLWRGSRLNLVEKSIYFWHTGFYFLSIANAVLMATLLASLAFHLRLTVGGHNENLHLIAYLAVVLVLGRISWLCLWWDVPQAIQSKNREESRFWWMTPFFFSMCMKAIFAYSSTFEFIPTSNIDRNAAAAAWNPDRLSISKLISFYKPVAVHLTFAIAVAITVAGRSFYAWTSNSDCNETFLVVGLSVFLVITAAHMLVPVIYLITHPNFKQSQRKSLLRYDAYGVPGFFPHQDGIPKWTCSVIFYELLSVTNLVFWTAVLVYVLQSIRSGPDTNTTQWC